MEALVLYKKSGIDLNSAILTDVRLSNFNKCNPRAVKLYVAARDDSGRVAVFKVPLKNLKNDLEGYRKDGNILIGFLEDIEEYIRDTSAPYIYANEKGHITG